MKYLTLTILASLIVLPGCETKGSFCDIYSEVLFERDLALDIVKRDRAAAEAIAVNQTAYERCK
jgi:hypothetical protein